MSGARKSKYTKDAVQNAVDNNKSVAGCLRHFGLAISGGNYRMIQGKIRYHGIDTSHFTGQLWSFGETASTDPRIRRTGYTDDEVFCNPSPIIGGKSLRPRMLKSGFVYECEICHIDKWLDSPLRLHVDHIDGNASNCEKSNLRFLCPNCHQQKDTWGNKRTK